MFVFTEIQISVYMKLDKIEFHCGEILLCSEKMSVNQQTCESAYLY